VRRFFFSVAGKAANALSPVKIRGYAGRGQGDGTPGNRFLRFFANNFPLSGV